MPGRRDGLESRRGVDQIARDHPLVRRPEGDRRLAGQHAGAQQQLGADLLAERLDRGDEVERAADRALGVVLERGRRAPHRHDRVADELLDGPAVRADDLGRGREVAVQQLTDRLGVARLGQGREADEVGEQDRDEAALGGRCVAARRRRPRAPRRAGPSRTRHRTSRPARSTLRTTGTRRREASRIPRRTSCRGRSRSRMPGSPIVVSLRRVASIRAAWHEGQRGRVAAAVKRTPRGGAIHAAVLRHRRRSRRRRFLGPLGIGVVVVIGIGTIVAGNGTAPPSIARAVRAPTRRPMPSATSSDRTSRRWQRHRRPADPHPTAPVPDRGLDEPSRGPRPGRRSDRLPAGRSRTPG